MFMGAMIVGPLGGIAIKKFDEAVHGKVKSGFEMLVNNFRVPACYFRSVSQPFGVKFQKIG